VAGNHLVLVGIPAGRLLTAPAPTGVASTSAEALTELVKLSVPLAAVAPGRGPGRVSGRRPPVPALPCSTARTSDGSGLRRR
jgi:hypothetical protein